MDEYNENDALWDLLGKAPKKEASPYFARKVMRAIAQEQERPRFSLAHLLRWLVPTAACAGLALAIGWTTMQHQREQEEFNAYFDTAADLQSLVVYEDSPAWMDTN